MSHALAFQGTTHIAFVLDRSSSMESIRDAAIAGFNEWLLTMQRDDSDTLFTLTLFADEAFTPLRSEPIANISLMDRNKYEPMGSTALYDAIWDAVSQIENDVLPTDRALVVILTDGQENCSSNYGRAETAAMIESREGRGNWTFTYLSATLSSFADAAGIGIKPGNVANFQANPSGAKEALRVIAERTMAYAATDQTTTETFYLPEGERKSAPQWTKT
jgi:hypothetical protein